MKRLMFIVLNLILIVGLVGCTPKATEAVEVPPTAAPEMEEVEPKLSGEISFSTWGSLDEKLVNELIIAEFEKDYPGTKVNLEYIPDDYITKIETMFVGGTAPDVIYGHPHYFANWASKGLLMDLDAYFAEDADFFYNENEFIVPMYEAFKWNGKHIATINGSDTFLLFYNKDMFDKAGVAYPDDNWTWDDFVAAGQKLTIPEGDNKQFGFSISSWPYNGFPFVFSHGGKLFDDMNNPTKAVFDSPETVAGLQFTQDLIYKYQIAPTVQDSANLGGSFDTGKVAMDITGMWAVVFRRNITDFKWDVANLPLAAGQPRRRSLSMLAMPCIRTPRIPIWLGNLPSTSSRIKRRNCWLGWA